MKRRIFGPRAVVVAIVLSLTGAPALAQQPAASSNVPNAGREANKHFQRAVSLYNDGDFRAALIEFRRAYEVSPNPGVLYNIGQAYFQLQNYALALTTFERYLTESGSSASHRAEVEGTIETLRARVGRVDVSTNVTGAEVLVDDEPVGKSPLAQPVLVSVGRRKVSVSPEGRVPTSRYVDVAAGDTVAINVSVADTTAQTPAQVAKTSSGGADTTQKAEPWKGFSSGMVTAGWVVTGVLAAGAVTTGVLALHDASALKTARETYPTTRDDLERKRSRTAAFATATDVLGAGALVAGGFTLYMTLSRSGEGANAREVKLGMSPTGFRLNGSF